MNFWSIKSQYNFIEEFLNLRIYKISNNTLSFFLIFLFKEFNDFEKFKDFEKLNQFLFAGKILIMTEKKKCRKPKKK